MSASREKRKRRELETQGLTKKQIEEKKAKAAKHRNSIIKSVSITALAIVVVFMIVINSGMLETTLAAATVNDEKITVAEYNYYYWDSYNSYINQMSDYLSYIGLDTSSPLSTQKYYADETKTWADYFNDSAQSTIKDVKIVVGEAEKAGYSLPEDKTTEIDSIMTNLDSYATSQDFKSSNAYLVSIYGKGCNTENYRDYLTDQYINENYIQSLKDAMIYTDDQLSTYYTDNKNDFDDVSYRSFFVDGAATDTEDADAAMATAKETADKFVKEANTEQAFADLAYEYASDDDKTTYEDKDATLTSDVSYSSADSTFVSWLYDAARIQYETTSIESSNGYYVVMFIERHRNDYNTVNVRHILFQPATDDDGNSTDADWETAKSKAESVYAAWKDGDATEDSFAEMATQNSEDTSSSSNGGLYEGVYKGQMVAEFTDWCFDSSRKAGDTGIIKSDYGYHIMYYVGQGDIYWKTQVKDTMIENDYTTWFDNASSGYTVSFKSFALKFTKKDA